MQLSAEPFRTFRFADFELDVRARELRTGTRRIRLQEQPFEILRMMLERPGEVVTREELQRRLWPDGTFVDFEHALNAAVKRLRAALGDDAENPRFVETLPRRGYRFIATLNGLDSGSGVASRPPSQPRLVVLPLTNLSDDPANEYFSDGLTEELGAGPLSHRRLRSRRREVPPLHRHGPGAHPRASTAGRSAASDRPSHRRVGRARDGTHDHARRSDHDRMARARPRRGRRQTKCSKPGGEARQGSVLRISVPPRVSACGTGRVECRVRRAGLRVRR